MRKGYEYAWSISWMRGSKGSDLILGTFTTKAKALEAIDFWADDGEFTPVDLEEKKPFDNHPCVVNITRWGKAPAMLFVHMLVLDNGAAIARMKYEK
jgi:hypothetical protein